MQELAAAIVATMREPVVVLDRDLRVHAANRAFHALCGADEQATVGRRLDEVGDGQWDLPELRDIVRDVADDCDAVRDCRVDREFEGLGRRAMVFNARRLVDDAERARILLEISDVTESERLREEVLARAEFCEKLIDSVREALLVLDPDLRVLNANEPFFSTFQVTRDEVEGRHIYAIVNGQWDIPELRHALEDILPRNHAFDDFEVTHDFPAIGRRTMLLNGRRMDHMPRILLAIRDVTEQRRHQADQRVLMGELQHRVKNILANVQATATATLRRSRSLAEFETAFLQRLASMARTQDVLMRAASGRARIRDLVLNEIEAHGWTEDGRFGLNGPTVTLSPREAQVLAMLLHELMTNAVKYGAFSGSHGRVDVSWRLEARAPQKHLHLEWRESGLAMDASPGPKGFGSRLIEHSVRYSLGGASSLDFTPDGAVWSASFPLAGGSEAGDEP